MIYPICPDCGCNTVVAFTPPKEPIQFSKLGTPDYIDWTRSHLYCCNGETNCKFQVAIVDLSTPLSEPKYKFGSNTNPNQKEKIMSDPILDSMFEGEDFAEDSIARAFDPEYGKGKWPNAILRDVEAGKEGEYARAILLKLDLKGEEGMPFTIFADAPYMPEENGDIDKYEKHLRGYGMALNKLKTLIHATGQWVEFNERGYVCKTSWPRSFTDFRNEENYNKLWMVFQQLIGSKLPVNVKYRTYTKGDGSQGTAKDVWGMDPRKA